MLVFVAAVVFTNGYHSFVYKITVHPDKDSRLELALMARHYGIAIKEEAQP